MPLIRGSRSNRELDLAPDELQNVHKAKESTWDQMVQLFLTPYDPSPTHNNVKQNGHEIKGPIDVDTCESRFAYDEKQIAQVVAREQPEEGDLLDYVFENVESTVCRDDAETENKTNENYTEGVAINSLRRNNSLLDLDDLEADMSMNGNTPKPRDGDELFVSGCTGEIVHVRKQNESERERTTTAREPIDDAREGTPDVLDYVFQNTESFVCGETVTPEEMTMDPDEDDGIIGGCSFHNKDPELLKYAKEPEPPTQTKEEAESRKLDKEQKSKADMLDHVFENTESFVCGERIGPQDTKVDAEQEEEEEEEDYAIAGTCFECFRSEEYELMYTDDHDALVAQAKPQYYEDAFEAGNAELIGMVVGPYGLNRDISVISSISAGEVSQATTAAIGNVAGAQKISNKKKINILSGVFRRRKEKR